MKADQRMPIEREPVMAALVAEVESARRDIRRYLEDHPEGADAYWLKSSLRGSRSAGAMALALGELEDEIRHDGQRVVLKDARPLTERERIVAAWHWGEIDGELHEALGMTWDEYVRWVERGK